MTALHTNNGVQALELVDRFFDDLFAGKKRNTWRYKEQPVTPGFLVFEASVDPQLIALVWVDDVAHVKLADVHTVLEGENTPPDELLAGMRRHYPDIELDSEVMIVKHISPAETYRKYGLPDELLAVLGEAYIEKVKNND